MPTRVCGELCHTAKGPICRCWCGGLFHGRGGEPNRVAFLAVADRLPMTEADFDHMTQPGLFDDQSVRGADWRQCRRDWLATQPKAKPMQARYCPDCGAKYPRSKVKAAKHLPGCHLNGPIPEPVARPLFDEPGDDPSALRLERKK